MIAYMEMRITDIEVEGFRNYDRFALHDLGNLVILVGRNGVGKTNLLEAVQLLTSARSFRHPQVSQLISEGRDAARAQIRATDGNRLITTALALEPGKRRYTVNGKPKSAADIRGTLPSVVFTPDDLQLAKKASSVKRASLDEVGAQLARNYHVVLADYEKTLRYKNRLLKEEAPSNLIDAINETLVTCGSQLFCYRMALFTRFIPQVKRYYAQISGDGEPFSATYQPSWDHLNETAPPAELPLGENGAPNRDEVRSLLADALQRHAAEELSRRRSLVGPHNDKLAFYLANRDTSAFASQGQQRSIVLAWKMGEVQMVRQSLGVAPVLLLDDVMSELDSQRRNVLVNFTSADTQTFITATDLAAFNPAFLDRAQVVHLG